MRIALLIAFVACLLPALSHSEIRAIKQPDGSVLLTNVKTKKISCSTGCVYVYKNKTTGAEHWTNKKASWQEVRDKQLTLLKKIPIRGRPTAVTSCYGMTTQKFKQRIHTYEPFINIHAKIYGVEPALVKAVIHAESCFDKKAVSRVGARGLMQLMPGTASDLGVDNSFDPNQNIRGGTQYLSQLQKQFNDFDLVLAAYNAGPQNVLKYKGIPPFKETQKYVKRVNKFYKHYTQSF